jgi:predicted nucleic acid-binding protein
VAPAFARWAQAADPVSLYLSAITVMELETGIRLLERRDVDQARLLRDWLEAQVLPTFANRILPVDVAIARRCATLHVPDRRNDRDALIAATALVHGMTVVTRNVADFEGAGVPLLDPWC